MREAQQKTEVSFSKLEATTALSFSNNFRCSFFSLLRKYFTNARDPPWDTRVECVTYCPTPHDSRGNCTLHEAETEVPGGGRDLTVVSSS